MKVSPTNKMYLFLFGCIPTRLLFVLLAGICPLKYLPALGLLALIPAIGFATIFLGDLRKTGFEVVSGKKVWWNDLRPIHSLFYLGFAMYAIKKRPFAWVFLLLDVIFGFVSFLVHYHMMGEF